MKVDPLKRLLSKIEINKEGCHIYAGRLSKSGYGEFSYKGKKTRAHRTSYELQIGPIPKGKCVLHKCDVRNCVNPEHLYIGTHKQNMEDMTNRGRQAHNESHGMFLHGESAGEKRLEFMRKYSRKYYKENKEKCKEASRRYRTKNREKINEYQRQYRQQRK